MARRKRKVHHRRRRSSRVGAIDVKKIGTKVLGVAGGAFVGRTLANVAGKSFPTLSGTYVGLGVAAIGVLVPKFIKNDLGVALGDGLLAIGVLQSMQSLNVIQGVGNTTFMTPKVPTRVIGAGNRPFLSKMVGASGRPYLRQMVGGGRMGSAYGVMESMNRSAMGAAVGSLAIEE
jgi:hypothetical protein